MPSNTQGKKTAAIILFAVLVFALFSCSNTTSKAADILTQKTIPKGKTPITVLVKYAFSINNFEKIVEEKFPEIDIIQVGNYTGNMGVTEYASRLEHDDLTDIVMTWPITVGEEYLESRLLDLSGMDFTSRYKISLLNEISKNGKLYYLPGPSQVRGIIYNKTLFEENNWQVPTNFEDFITLCKTIEKSGIRSLQLGFANREVLDTAFVGYNYAQYFSKPQDIQWISDYNEGKGSFGKHFRGALDVFQHMIDEGIWKESDLAIDYSVREQMLFTRQCAMIEDSVLMARMGFSYTGNTDEFALMPFFNSSQEGDWARIYMVCFIGLNKHLAEPQNKAKYDHVIKLMDYISTPEGQEALASDTGAMFSSLIGVQPPHISEIQNLLPALNHGRYAIFPQLKNAQDALRSGLEGMLRGTITKEAVIKMVDQQNLSPPLISPPQKWGTAASDFSIIETGNFVTDVMRNYSKCDIALFLDNGKDGQYNGKGISARLYKGDVTDIDIARILPDLKQGACDTLWEITMSGADLITTLEYAIPVNNNITGWFYYFSGLCMKYDPLAKQGSRISSITTADKQAIDPEKLYSIAILAETVPQEFIQSCIKTNSSISSILAEAIKNEGIIFPKNDGRFRFP